MFEELGFTTLTAPQAAVAVAALLGLSFGDQRSGRRVENRRLPASSGELLLELRRRRMAILGLFGHRLDDRRFEPRRD